jgi:hypothetical protein
MANCLQKEGLVPASAFDFASYRDLKRQRLEDVEAQLSHERKILGRMVLSRSIAILGKNEHQVPGATDSRCSNGSE